MMRNGYYKHEFALFLGLLVMLLVAIGFAIGGVTIEKKLEEAKTPIVEEKIEVKQSVLEASEDILGCLEGHPSRKLPSEEGSMMEFVVFDTEKHEFLSLIEHIKEAFNVENSADEVYFQVISREKGLVCSLFWSGNDEDSAQLTYVSVADLKVKGGDF